MDRKWFQYILAFLDFVLVKGVVKIGALILLAQAVTWLIGGPSKAWPDWTAREALGISDDLVACLPLWIPWALCKVAQFFVGLPLFVFVPLAGWTIVGVVYLTMALLVAALVQTSAFFRQVFLGGGKKPPKHIAICTDGTWNYPEHLSDGVIDGTNVYKFWDLLKGDRRHGREIWVGANRLKKYEETVERNGKKKKELRQIGLYYNGVGNKAEHTQLGIVIGGAFGLGAKKIVKRAYRDLIRFYREGDSISICGFSRGAAVARLLAAEVGKRGLPRYAFSDLPVIKFVAFWIARKMGSLRRPEIDLLGVWDTVGAFGISKNILGIPFQSVNLFKDLTVGQTVRKAVHMLALDEQRDSFAPTLITPTDDENREVKEVWFPGNHSNVGGGYASNTLSNIPLRYFCKEAHLFRGKGIFKRPVGEDDEGTPIYEDEPVLPLLQFRTKKELLAQDARREEDREKKLKKLEEELWKTKRHPRPHEYALYGFEEAEQLAPILYPEEGFKLRTEIELVGGIMREESPLYTNVPRFVPSYARLDESVRYKMELDPSYAPESVMQYYEREKKWWLGQAEKVRALMGPLEEDEGLVADLAKAAKIDFDAQPWLEARLGADKRSETKGT